MVAYAEAPGLQRPADLGDGEEMRPSGRARCPSPGGSGKPQGDGLAGALCNCGTLCDWWP